MGMDKASLLFSGEPFLSRICRLITPIVSPIVVVSSDNQQLPNLPDDVAVTPDLWQDEGPLAGLLTGLEFLAQHSPKTQKVWLGSCDAPYVNARIVNYLCQTPGPWDAVMVRVTGRRQPFGAVYATSLHERIHKLFESGERRLDAIAPQIKIATIDAESLREFDPTLKFLKNINTPKDYKLLRNQS
jgi:molybdenum cofactor guanylyltransferase